MPLLDDEIPFGGKIYITDNNIILESVQAKKFGKVIVFDSHDGSLSIEDHSDEYTTPTRRAISEYTYFGLIGLTDLVFAKYIWIITGRERAASNESKSIAVWRIVNVKPICIWRKSLGITLDDEEYEKEIMRGIYDHMTSSNLYFSFDLDLTRPICHWETGGFLSQRFLVRCDRDPSVIMTQFNDLSKEYLWNQPMLSQLGNKNIMTPFIVPIICGHVSSQILELDGPAVSFFQITRLNRHSAGTRYWTRGINSRGFVSMESQTELVLIRRGFGITSVVFERGAIPGVYSQKAWTQPFSEPRLDTSMLKKPVSSILATHHFQRYLQRGPGQHIHCVNVISRKYQAIHEAFKEFVADYGNRLHILSFHDIQETVKETTIDDVLKDLPSKTSFYVSKHSSISSRQTGIIRLSSVDCLEELASAQISISKSYLREMLKSLDVWSTCRIKWDSRNNYLIKQSVTDCIHSLCIYSTDTPSFSIGYGAKMVSFVNPVVLSRTLWIFVARKYMAFLKDYSRQDVLEFMLYDPNQTVTPITLSTEISPLKSPDCITISKTLSGTPRMTNDKFKPKLSGPLIRETWVLSPSVSPLVESLPVVSSSSTTQPVALTSACTLITTSYGESPHAESPRSSPKKSKLYRTRSFREYAQPWYISYILVLRRITAPRHVDTLFERIGAFFWIVIHFILIVVFRVDPFHLMRVPESKMMSSPL